MGQEWISDAKTVGIIGGGPAGCICARYLCNNNADVTIFDKGKFLRTILPTGGGRCNLANAQYDFKELAKYYPRGEKFLYSVFSQFDTQSTIDFFKSIGVDTYVQEKDNRIFPKSDSSADVREKLLKSLDCKFINEEITNISIDKNKYVLKNIFGKEYSFDYLVIAIGGHSSFGFINNLGIKIVPLEQSLVGFLTKDNYNEIAGVSLKNVSAFVDKKVFSGDVLFTHKGISGPLIYEISSVYARKDLPFCITLQLVSDIDLQKVLNENPHKDIKNILGQYIPKSLAEYILKKLEIMPEMKASAVNSKIRDVIVDNLQRFNVYVIKKFPEGEIVTCGGVDLNEINSKTMESKLLPNLYFCGEVLDIDGFCGGFNLQNCWSTGYVAAKSIIEKLNHCS